MPAATDETRFMAEALVLAEKGRGAVEPNPMVGCVLVNEGQIVGRGYHQRFGGPHAEIEALSDAGDAARSATAYVTLEPCCHQGKTGPCTEALIAAGVSRVFVGCEDPNPQVAGQGITALREAGVEVSVPVLAQRAKRLIAPFAKLMTTGRPWVIAKWAMTLDGKIATHTGDSQWISGEASRAVVHRFRGQVDAIIVGRGTADADDPLLTARPPGARIATRIVLDSQARLASDSQLVRTASEAPVLVVATDSASAYHRERLRSAGVEVLALDGDQRGEQLDSLLDELGRRQMTNVLVEGGSGLLGSLFDQRLIDEVQCFISPKLVGGQTAPSPIGGAGLESMSRALHLEDVHVEILDGDVYLQGYIAGR